MAQLTKKDFVLEITESLKNSAKTVLMGHGLSGAMLSLIASRPDVIAKIVGFTTNTINWKKGKNALKKTKNFKILAYKNFNEFNKKGQLDIDKFVAQLDKKDAETFVANNNSIVMLCLPEKTVDENNLENEVANSKSQLLKFDKAVTSQYKIPSGFYIVIVFGDSVILTKAMAKAEREKGKNKRMAERANKIANVKKTFINKNKSKLANLEKEKAKLVNQLDVVKHGDQHLANALQQFNILSGKVADIKAGKEVYDRTIKNELLKLSDSENQKLQNARQLWRTGYQKDALAEIKSIKSADKNVIKQYVMQDGLIDSNSKLDKSISKHSADIAETRRQLADARRSMKAENITPLAKKKAKAEIERLNKRKAMQELALENAKKLRENKSVNAKSSADSLTKKIDNLTAKGLDINKATEQAVRQMQIAKTQQEALLAKINGNIGQQVAQQTVENITPQVAKQLVSDAVQQAIIDTLDPSEIAPKVTSKRTPLMQKKAKAQRERNTKKAQLVAKQKQQVAQQKGGVNTQQNPNTKPDANVGAKSTANVVKNTAKKVNGSISKTGKGSGVAPKQQAPNDVVNVEQKTSKKAGVGSKKTTPLVEKKAKAERERNAKRQALARQQKAKQMSVPQINVDDITDPISNTVNAVPDVNVGNTKQQSNDSSMDLVSGDLLSQILKFA